MIDLGIVTKVTAEEAQQAWSSPLHLQTKPDLTERPCGDFRKLNDCTLQEAYQLPNLNQFSSHIKKSKIFSKIDMSKAFHFVPIKRHARDLGQIPHLRRKIIKLRPSAAPWVRSQIRLILLA